MENLAQLISINVSKGGIPKWPIESVRVTINGLEGDGHNHDKHNTPFQAVCLQDIEKLEELYMEGYPLFPGTTGENLTVRNLHVNALPIGTILRFSNGVVIELTKIRNPCYVLDAIHPDLKKDIINRCGVYAKILEEGIIKMGEAIEVMRPCGFSRRFINSRSAAGIHIPAPPHEL